MKKLQTLILQLLLGVSLTGAVSSPASAAPYAPFYYHGLLGTAPYGYGYFNYFNWPVWYWNMPVYSGYSLWPYYDYQPYYATFAVISFSVKTGRYGVAYGQPSRDDASKSANNACQAEDCQPVVWVQGGCAVVVTSVSQEKVTWSYGNSTSIALNGAMDACKMNGNAANDCKGLAWACSY